MRWWMPAALAAVCLTACTSGAPHRAADSVQPTTAATTPLATASSTPSAGYRSQLRTSHPAVQSSGPASKPARQPPVVPATSASIAGCPLFPASNPWRQNISRAPIDPHSQAWVASIGADRFLHPDFGSNPAYGIPYSVVPASQPKVKVGFTAYGDESDPGPYPIPSSARIEAGGDAHVLVASGDCHLYELYGAARSATGWTAQSAAIFNLNSNGLRPAGWTSADAAGLPILPGLVRRDEVLAGHIDHALRFTISQTQRGYLSPARHSAASTSSPDVAPMGARFRLKASFSLAGYHGMALVILQCLKNYGMFVADNGSNWFLSGAIDSRWDDGDLDQLKKVPGSTFEAIDSGPVHTG